MAALRALITVFVLFTLTACVTQGKPGTPLPPQNKAVGQKWAPEARQFIDTMLEVFVDGKPAPSTAQMEAAFGVKAVADGDALTNKRYGLESSYELQGWLLKDPSVQSWSASYVKLIQKNGKQSYSATFYIDTQRYCINPYDFAIYTGREFAARMNDNTHVPLELPDEYYRQSYQWGMFDWSPSGQYDSGRMDFTLDSSRRCIGTFEPSASFSVSGNGEATL